MFSCRTKKRPEINGIAQTPCVVQKKRCYDTCIPLFLSSFDSLCIISNFNKNIGAITSFLCRRSFSATFLNLIRSSSVKRKFLSNHYASSEYKLYLLYVLMVTQTQEYMETGAADAHAFLGK